MSRYVDRTVRGQSETISFEFEFAHPPAKVWRALTEPALLAQWLLPFTLVVLVVSIAMAGDEPPPQWLYMMPLPLLGLLWLSGIYLYVLPYVAKKRNARIGVPSPNR